jgi:hypothetical protein
MAAAGKAAMHGGGWGDDIGKAARQLEWRRLGNLSVSFVIIFTTISMPFR